MNKKCSCCKEIKSLEYFYIDKATKNGRCYECISCQKIRLKKYRENNRDKCRKSCMKNMRQNIVSWLGFIPKETNCECCGKSIFFLSDKRENAIHFDHRHGESVIKIPVPWLWKHKFNEKNRGIWESCDFGILCGSCNMRLPTIDRDKWFKNVEKYIYGTNKNIYAHSSSSSIGSGEQKV